MAIPRSKAFDDIEKHYGVAIAAASSDPLSVAFEVARDWRDLLLYAAEYPGDDLDQLIVRAMDDKDFNEEKLALLFDAKEPIKTPAPESDSETENESDSESNPTSDYESD